MGRHARQDNERISGILILLCLYSILTISTFAWILNHGAFPYWRSLQVGSTIENNTGRNETFNDQRFAVRHIIGSQLEVTTEETPSNVSLCSAIPPSLAGPINVSINASHVHSSEHFSGMETGGRWVPRDCVARHRVAIIVPFRGRQSHLSLLLYYLIPMLKRQQLEFRLFVVEQQGNALFNKGRLMNAGFLEAMKEEDYQCVIFHDVDLLPENDKNMYSCPATPKHLSVSIDKYKYKLSYPTLIGGVLNFPIEAYKKVNGYTNLLWSWGSEDDEMSIRIQTSGLRLSRPPSNVARYKAIPHPHSPEGNRQWRAKIVKSVPQRKQKDGLNSVSYNVTSKVYEKLYTHLLVDIGQPPEQMPHITKL